MHGRQFDWGGLLLKGNGGVRRYARCTVGNRADSAMAKACLTARATTRADAAGHSDPVALNGRAIAQRIKGTLGITG